jgi:hypothetical protein
MHAHRIIRGTTWCGPGLLSQYSNVMGWTVWGSNPGGGKILRACPDRPWGPPSLLYNGYQVFHGVQQQGPGTDNPHPSRAMVKERVALYLYSTSGPLWAVIRWTLLLQHDHTATMYSFKQDQVPTSPHMTNISAVNSQTASPNMWVTV